MTKTVFRIQIQLGADGMTTCEDIAKFLKTLTKKRLNAIADSGEDALIYENNAAPIGMMGFYLEGPIKFNVGVQ